MKTAKLFQNAQGQALQLPEEFRFEGDEIGIAWAMDGLGVVLFPPDKAWDAHLEGLFGFTDDFLPQGRPPQGEFEKREELL
jgi:antitoxin VapB